MNKVILVVVTVVVVAAIGVVVFINSNAEPITREEAGLDKMTVGLARGEDVIGETEEMLDDQEYIENQVVAVAESKREAKKIAKQIGGELISYDNQVAVIQIGETVEELMQQIEEDSSLPKVYPNYQGYQNYAN